MRKKIGPQILASVVCLIGLSLPTLGTRQLLCRRQRDPPHPDAQSACNNDRNPASPDGKLMRVDLDCEMREQQPVDMDKAHETENDAGHPQTSSL